MDYRIFPPEEILETTVTLPLSKSVANRALAIAALSPAPTGTGALPDCDDTNIMICALENVDAEAIDCGAAGTAMRFLTAVFAAREGREVTLTGSERMLERPIGPLVDALRACGAHIEYAGREGYPPLRIRGRALAGGDVTMEAATSSQFVSALLMAAPMMAGGLRLRLDGEIVSEPYIGLTMAMMVRAGADVSRDRDVITVSPRPYTAADFEGEADWSAAAFWYEIEALTSGFVTIANLSRDSAQGDRAVADIYSDLGVVTDYDGETPGATDLLGSPDTSPRLYIDLSSTPDLVPALTVTCVMLRIPFRFSGLSTLRIKESDRVEALRTELARVGAILESETPDTLEWEGRFVPVGEMPVFDPHGDHRMAMALAPVALYIPGIVVRDAEVVSKSYPGYWDDLRAAGFTVTDVAQEAEQPSTPGEQ